MKKAILTSLALSTLTCFSYAAPRTADRHGLETPEDYQSSAITTSTTSRIRQNAMITALGKKYVSIGGNVNVAAVTSKSPFNESHEFLGAGAQLEFSYNVFKSENDDYGVDLALPLQYNYMSFTSACNFNEFRFPVYVRPYYRFKVSEDFVITPYGNFGIGGSYIHTSLDEDYGSIVESGSNMYLIWGAGCGVEFAFLQDFALTPKYQYYNIEEKPSYYDQKVSIEFSWKFCSNMVLSAEYEYMFSKISWIQPHVAIAKVRYEF